MIITALHSLFWIWLIIAGIFLVSELFAGYLFFLFWAIAAGITAVISLFFPKLNFFWQCGIFAILTLIVLIIWWLAFAKLKYREQRDTASFLNNRGKSLIGQKITLTKAIENQSCHMQLGDTFWILRGEDAPVGTIVEIINVNSMELEVKRVA